MAVPAPPNALMAPPLRPRLSALTRKRSSAELSGVVEVSHSPSVVISPSIRWNKQRMRSFPWASVYTLRPSPEYWAPALAPISDHGMGLASAAWLESVAGTAAAWAGVGDRSRPSSRPNTERYAVFIIKGEWE
jgi:hypothetical protein